MVSLSKSSTTYNREMIVLSLLRRRLTCRGDLATSCLRVLNPPSHFLVRAGHSCCYDVVTGIVLGSYSCYYAIVRGRGKKMRGEESRAWWKGGIDCKHSNNGSKWKGEARLNTQEWREAMLSIPYFHQEEWRPSQMTYLLYMDLLKGGSTLTLALAFLPSTYPCWPTAYDEWNTIL